MLESKKAGRKPAFFVPPVLKLGVSSNESGDQSGEVQDVGRGYTPDAQEFCHSAGQGNMGVSRWQGLSPSDLRRVRSAAKIGGVVSSLTIGMSAYDLQQAAREGDGFGVVNSGADLGFGLYGLTGPVGAIAATAYGGMSLLLEIPAVYDHTVTPIVDIACKATSNC